ncbi:hypothetical protein A9P82_07720 [Arachidicoccus ginsenosidimutans]|uniref:hypothetical protein n=1 Tax=Arachidicoccus sp. BS20 TaxID=1850526 RepID=UPI0007F15C5D|nr:hypothetical protein [Arachidicoccus sp. BS20]ANI89189.1 hypothetical protein A9P82_07720 [Arachidicoccus sp. BS20]
MKKKFISIITLSLSVLIVSFANAQFLSHLKNKIEQKANDAVDKVLDKNSNTTTSTTAVSNPKKFFEDAAKTYDFHAGTTNVFQDNFEEDSLGAMAQYWKTSGSGSIRQFPDENGKWLSFKEFTSYKLKSDKPLPQNFTIEFDIATHSNTSASDLESLSFGFAHDNNISEYISDAYNEKAITSTEIQYGNEAVVSSSSDTKIYNTTSFPLAQYAVGKMHVAIAVNGNNMRVYLDKVKVLDTQMFLSSSKNKYFYFSTSTQLDNGAKIGIGNFKIDSM